MLKTTNYVLNKPEGTDVVNVQDFNDNADIIDIELKKLNTSTSDLTYQTAGGTATSITLTTQALVNGYAKTFIASTSNGGAATTINGKPLYKPGTTTAPTLIAGKAYTVWYNSASSCFFIKASAEGNTTASHVLAGDGFSNDTDTGLIGTMVNRSVTGDDYFNNLYPTLRINKGGAIQYGSYGTTSPAPRLAVCPPIGWYPGGGSSYVTMEASEVASALGITASKILSGNTICNVAGTATNDAVLDPAFLVQGYSGYDDGILKQGTMVNRPGTVDVTGYWANGAGYLNQWIPYGAYISDSGSGSGTPNIRNYDANFIASNIISGKSIFGVAGTAVSGRQYASGIVVNSTSVTLAFSPAIVYVSVLNTAGNNWAYYVLTPKNHNGWPLSGNLNSSTVGFNGSAFSVNGNTITFGTGLSTSYTWLWEAWQ